MPQPEKDRSPGFDIGGLPKPATHIGDYYLFVVAIDNYDQSPNAPQFAALNNPVLDASRVVDLLTSKYSFHKPDKGKDLSSQYNYDVPVIEYDDIRTKCLYNENATFTNISTHFIKLRDTVKEDDCVLIYFAGHGVEANDLGYLIPFDAINNEVDINTWCPIQLITSYFNKYPDKKKCRHFLMVLDACYAGTSFLGSSEKTDDDFSRYVLTSAGSDEKASDGIPEEGSPFANALIAYLNENTKPQTYINKAVLDSKFDIILQNLPNLDQTLKYEPLPLKNGSGAFPFQLRDKDQPPIEDFARSLIQNLNFQSQKGELSQQLVAGGTEELYIFSSVIPSSDVKVFLKKVLIQQLKNFEFAFPKDTHLINVPTSLMGDGNIQKELWKLLSAHHELTITNPANQKEVFVDWLIGLLTGEKLQTEPIRPVVIALEYTGTPNILHELLLFCKDFSELFVQKKQNLKPNQTLGKLFIFLSDNRIGELFKNRSEVVQTIGNHPKIVVTSQVSSITKFDVIAWINFVKGLLKSNSVQNLNTDLFFSDQIEKYPLFEFIDILGKHCYSDKKDLYDHLIDFEKPLF